MTKARRWLLPALMIVAFLLVGGPLGSLAGKVAEVQKNDSGEYLPASAEATRVQHLNQRFAGRDTMPALIVYTRPSGLTPADQEKIAADLRAIQDRFGGKLAGPPAGPVPSQDGRAAQVILQFAGFDAQKFKADVEWIRTLAGSSPGLKAHVGGPGGILADMMTVFDAINGVLLLATAGIVLLILVIVRGAAGHAGGAVAAGAGADRGRRPGGVVAGPAVEAARPGRAGARGRDGRHTGQLSCQSHMSSTRVGGPYRSVATRSSVG